MSALRRLLSSLNLFKEQMAHGLSLVVIKLFAELHVCIFVILSVYLLVGLCVVTGDIS